MATKPATPKKMTLRWIRLAFAILMANGKQSKGGAPFSIECD
jgi:hypothetical protein